MSADDDTTANIRNSKEARTEIANFLAWIRQRDDFSQVEKDKIARLAAEYHRTGRR